MRRAFTLIEMMVVIVIVASLAAIIFPVYGRAKIQGKRAVETSHLHELAMAAQLYLDDYDQIYFPRKVVGEGGVNVTGAQALNPDYQIVRAAHGQTVADQLFGPKTRNVEFYSQVLAPYVKSQDIWMSPACPSAWVGADPYGLTEDPDFRSYGGQNSIGLNLDLFSVDTASGATGGIGEADIDHLSETYLMTSANYYVVASRNGLQMPANVSGSLSPVPFNPCREPFFHYWKNLGNSRWALYNPATSSLDPVPDQDVMNTDKARFNGFVLTLFADSHVRSISWAKVLRPIASFTGQYDPNAAQVANWDPSDDLSNVNPCTASLPDNDPDGINR